MDQILYENVVDPTARKKGPKKQIGFVFRLGVGRRHALRLRRTSDLCAFLSRSSLRLMFSRALSFNFIGHLGDLMGFGLVRKLIFSAPT
jgi:hypothetical protein